MAVLFGELSAGDITIIALYLVIILIVGLAATLRPNRSSAEGYFLAGGTVMWLQVGCSLFGSNIGSEHFVGLAGSAAASGYAVVLFEWLSVFSIQILAWLLLPVYMASAIYTMPEYLGKRYGGRRIQMTIAVISLIFYIFAKISVDLYAGALFVKVALHWDLYFSIMMLLVVAAIYTAAGGLAAVIYTETVQVFVMVIGGSIVSIYAISEVGGIKNLERRYMSRESYPNETLNNETTCGIPRADSLHIWRGLDSDLPWLAFLLGSTWCSLWYWAADQVIVQRMLAVKNLSHGRGAALLTSVLKILPMFLMIFPGMAGRILFADTVACVDPQKCMEICDSPIGCSNIAYPKIVVSILPHGIRGLVTAVMLSALMSSLASTFNSSSTIFTLDIWCKLRKLPSADEICTLNEERRRKYNVEIMIVGRLCVFALVVISVLWIPVVQGSSGSQLFIYIQDISCTISPPICAVFLLGIFWERATEKGAFAGILGGFIISCCRLLLTFIWTEPACGQVDTRPAFIAAIYIHYQWFALVLFTISVLINVSVSFLTDPIPPEYLYRLTYKTRFSRETRKDITYLNEPELEPILATSGTDEFQLDRRTIEHQQSENVDAMQPNSQPEPLLNETNHTESIQREDGNGIKNADRGSNTAEKVETAPSCWWKFVSWFCGIPSSDMPGMCEEDLLNREQKQMDKIIEERRPITYFLLIVLGLVLCIYTFLFIYFA